MKRRVVLKKGIALRAEIAALNAQALAVRAAPGYAAWLQSAASPDQLVELQGLRQQCDKGMRTLEAHDQFIRADMCLTTVFPGQRSRELH